MANPGGLHWHLLTNTLQTQNFTEMFKKFQKENAFTDVCFVCKGGRKINVHKMLLIHFSRLCKELLLDHPVVSPDIIHIHIPDIESNIMQQVVDFIYSGIPLRMQIYEYEAISRMLNIVDVVVGIIENNHGEHTMSSGPASSTTSTNPQFSQDSRALCIPPHQQQHYAHNSGLAMMDSGRPFGGSQQLIHPHVPHRQMVPQQHFVDPGNQIIHTPAHSTLGANGFTLPVHQIMQPQAPVQVVCSIATNQPYQPYQNSTMALINQNPAPKQQQSFQNAASSQQQVYGNAVFNQQQTYQNFAPRVQQTHQNMTPNQQPYQNSALSSQSYVNLPLYQNRPMNYHPFQNNIFTATSQQQSSSTSVMYQSNYNGPPKQLYHHLTNQKMPAEVCHNGTQSSTLTAFNVPRPNQTNQTKLAVMHHNEIKPVVTASSVISSNQPNVDYACSRPIKTEVTEPQQSEPTYATFQQTSNASPVNCSVSFGTLPLIEERDEAEEGSKSLRRRKRPLDWLHPTASSTPRPQHLVQNRLTSTVRSPLQLPRASLEVPPSTTVPARRKRKAPPKHYEKRTTRRNKKL